MTKSSSVKYSKVVFYCLQNHYLNLLMVSFLMPFLFSVWQLIDADFGRFLLSPFAFSDASLYHYSAWYKSVFMTESYVSELIVFSPYERLLSASLKIFGHSTITPFVLNAVLNGLTCTMIVATTWQLFSPRSGWAALVIYCFTTPILFFSGLTIKTFLVLFLTSSAILLGVLFFKRPRIYLAIGFCLLMLLASIDRVHVLIGIVVFLGFLCWPSPNHTHEYRFSVIAIILLGTISFWVSSNQYGAEPKFVSNIGLNIYLGHSAPDNFLLQVRGVRNHIIGHRVDSKRLAEMRMKQELSQAEVTHYWLSQASDYIKNNPGSYLRGQAQKLHHLFAAKSNSLVGERANLWRGERWPLKLTFIDFALIFSLFVVAAIGLFKSGGVNRQQGFLVVFCVLYLLSGMATLVIERYRMVALVLMIPMAAWAAIYLCENIKNRWRLLLLGMAVFASSQLLAYTAPAQYRVKFDKHLAAEKNAASGRITDFYAAQHQLESELSVRACTRFLRELSRNKFDFDFERTQRACKSFRKNGI